MKYPIGTKIRYNPVGLYDYSGDRGKCGKIVGYESAGIIRIVLPNSYIAKECYGDASHYFTTLLSSLEILAQVGEQLLFSFMKE